MKKNILFCFAIAVYTIAATPFASGQSLHEQFSNAMSEGDSTEMARCIKMMRQANDQSAERYVDEFNYYVNAAHISHGPIISTEYPSEEGISSIYTLTDSTGDVSGYMYMVDRYDHTILDSGMTAIKEGIGLYPNRLDMRFGLAHILSELKRWSEYTDVLEQTIDHGKAIKNQWTFPDVDDPIDTVILYSMLEYERRLFDDCELIPETYEDDEYKTGLMRSIAEKMLTLYPDNSVQMNIIAVTYNAMDMHGKAVEWLLKAEKKAPKDIVILSNLMNTYNMMGDKKNEKKYLKKMIKYGNEETKAQAKEWLNELENNK